MPFLHIGMRLERAKAPTDRDIEAVLNKARDWYRYAPNCWVVYTQLTAEQWTDRLKEIPGIENNAQFFVAELNLQNRSGWAEQDFWDWLGKRRV